MLAVSRKTPAPAPVNDELLEACKAALAELDGTRTQDFGEGCRRHDAAVATLKAAIANATKGG
jgi:hypothetical protein